MNQSVCWWGERDIAQGQSAGLQIGPLSLRISHLTCEWRLSYEWNLEELADDTALTVDLEMEWPEDFAQVERYMFRDTRSKIKLKPLLADRPVVSRPVVPVHVPPGEEVTLFISSPLWVGFEIEQNALFKLPIVRPSDTWFGPSTLEGELCYASRTRGLLSQEELELRPHRAITPVLIRNRAKDELLLERTSLPVPYLSLYSAPDGMLWTESVTVNRETDAEMASLIIDKGAPQQAGETQLISTPQQSSDKSVLYRAFSNLFS